jgi:hypothetical protein
MAVTFPALFRTTTTTVAIAAYSSDIISFPRAPISASASETLVTVTSHVTDYTQSVPALLLTIGAVHNNSQTIQPTNATSLFTGNFPSLGSITVLPSTNYANTTFVFNNIPASVSVTTSGNIYPVKAVTVGSFNPNSNNGLPTIPNFNWYYMATTPVATVTIVDRSSSLQPPYQPQPMNVAEALSYTVNTVANNLVATTRVAPARFDNKTTGSVVGVFNMTDSSIPYMSGPIATAEASIYVYNGQWDKVSNPQTAYWSMS